MNVFETGPGWSAARGIAALAGSLLALIALCMLAAGPARAAETLSLDDASYNPLSLVLKQKHWLEDALGPTTIVQWVPSAGSNRALEYLRGGSIMIGSTAGSAALLGRANGVPVTAIYIYAEAEWTALATRPDSAIHSLADLRGRRVAATPGTDPGIFLLRALQSAGLSRRDITLVPLQHQDGRLALDRGGVDAWAGLDPFMAAAELQSGDRIFFRDRSLITPGTLLVRTDFAAHHPEMVMLVLTAYQKARDWALHNREAMIALLATTAKLPPEVARRQLERTDFAHAAIGPSERDSILAAARVLTESGSTAPDADLDRAAAELIDTRFTDRLVTGG